MLPVHFHIIHAILISVEIQVSCLVLRMYIVDSPYGLMGLPPRKLSGRPFDVYNVMMMFVAIYSISFI